MVYHMNMANSARCEVTEVSLFDGEAFTITPQSNLIVQIRRG